MLFFTSTILVDAFDYLDKDRKKQLKKAKDFFD